MRLVYEEDGYPRELLTALERERAVADGRLTVTTSVTVYRTATAPVMMAATEVEELRPLFGLTQETATPGGPNSPDPLPPSPRPSSTPPAHSTSRDPLGPPRTVVTSGAAVITQPSPEKARGSWVATPPAFHAEAEPEPFHADEQLWAGEEGERFDAGSSEPASYRPNRRPMLAVLILIALALVFAVVISMASDTGQEGGSEQRRVIKTTNVRSAPNTNATVVHSLKAGDVIEGASIEVQGGLEWFRVGSGPLEGRFVWIRNTTPLDAGTAPAPEATVSPSPASDPTACAGTGCRTLTARGWGDVRAGMRLDELAATGIGVKPDERSAGTQEEQADAEACSIRGVVGGPENLAIFVESGVITSVGVSSDQGGPRFVTDRGIGLGDSEAAVRRVYGSLKQEADIYGGPRDKKLFHRPDGEHGIKFSIVAGRVNAIDVGGGSIEYVEGCS